jgi:Ni,Fe-hydrogenase III large subunit
MTRSLVLRNGQAAARADVPVLPFDAFRDELLGLSAAGGRLAALLGALGPGGRVRLLAVVADDAAHVLHVTSTDVTDAWPSLTPELPQAHLFERDVAEQLGLRPEGHPWLKPVRFPRGDVGVTGFFQTEGSEVHEVAVGPVHAGIIEPGHFRFQCHGERVLHLEISLGYQHRGIERALQGGPGRRSLHLVETAAGDTTIGHATAWCQALESLQGRPAPARAEALRGVALELERLANHTGDLGALANDVGFLPTAAFCGRLRGEFLNLTATLCGSRFGRGLVVPGGVRFDVDAARATSVLSRLEQVYVDVQAAAKLLWNTASVAGRFEGAGTVSADTCERLGLVGPAARACGVLRDVRTDHPAGVYARALVPVSSWRTGDVFARALVRYYEIKTSVAFVQQQLAALPEGPIAPADPAPGGLRPEALVVSLVEGWRGEICHVALTDGDGRFAACKLFDPSFHNWTGLAMALRDEQISDFPLCNKSFNLSYCGHDL